MVPLARWESLLRLASPRTTPGYEPLRATGNSLEDRRARVARALAAACGCRPGASRRGPGPLRSGRRPPPRGAAAGRHRRRRRGSLGQQHPSAAGRRIDHQAGHSASAWRTVANHVGRYEPHRTATSGTLVRAQPSRPQLRWPRFSRARSPTPTRKHTLGPRPASPRPVQDGAAAGVHVHIDGRGLRKIDHAAIQPAARGGGGFEQTSLRRPPRARFAFVCAGVEEVVVRRGA